MLNEDIIRRLFENQDLAYKEFHSGLIPEIDKERIIGVRIPVIRKLAKEYSKNAKISQFLENLPHKYYEENNLHGFLISEMSDYYKVIEHLNSFLPFVDNWATCDSIRPKTFVNNKISLINEIDKWLLSEKTFTIRFGIEMLMVHYLEDEFKEEYLYKVSGVRSEEYYVKMMIAWYFATALAKQWNSAVKVLENRELDAWTHNKTIQKAIESYRITNDQKAYLRSLRIKNSSV